MATPSAQDEHNTLGRGLLILLTAWGPALLKGLLLIVGGLIIVATPDLSSQLLRLVLGTGLLVGGAVSFLRRLFRRRSSAPLSMGESLLALVGGAGLLAYPVASVELVASLLALYLLIAAAIAAVRGLRARGRVRAGHLLRAGAMAALGLITAAVPGALVSFLLATLATGALLVGAIIVAYAIRTAADPASARGIDTDSLFAMLVEWMESQNIGDRRRAEIADSLFFEPPGLAAKLVAWWVMLLLSVAIATFGVLQDSTAVVIGAMIVAPLMTPILGSAAAVVEGRLHRMITSIFMIITGTMGSVALAAVIAAWTPVVVPLASNSQILSRINPNVIDMSIALAAGAAGAFATVNSRVASSIAGVAIAVALVPPLAVVGINLQAGFYADGAGALLLFLTNLVSIQLAAVLVLFISGYSSLDRMVAYRGRIANTFGALIAIALMILLPLVLAVQSVLVSAQRSSTAQQTATTWLEDAEATEALSLDSVTVEGDLVRVAISGSRALPSVEVLGSQMAEALGPQTTTSVEFTPATTITYQPNGTVSTSGTPQLE